MPFRTEIGEIKITSYVGIVRDQRVLMLQYDRPYEKDRKGWSIPSPELKFGEHPEDGTKRTLQELGIRAVAIRLMGIESFSSGKQWNLMFSYCVETDDDLKKVPGVKRHGWFQQTGLPPASEMTYGAFEHNLALSFLE